MYIKEHFELQYVENECVKRDLEIGDDSFWKMDFVDLDFQKHLFIVHLILHLKRTVTTLGGINNKMLR